MIDLIYTSGDNAILASMTQASNWLVGMRSDKYATLPIEFLDIDYKKPDFKRHVLMAEQHRPTYAIVPDLDERATSQQDVMRALRQIDRLSLYCETVYLVPKLSKQLTLIPLDIPIAYSLPSSNGAAQYGVWKLAGRRIHLLGGNPHEQMRLYRLAEQYGYQVISADGNMAQKMAFQFGKYWEASTWMKHSRHGLQERDVSYECIQLSLRNIRQAWINMLEPNSMQWTTCFL
jgi:hypothetical protein